MNAQTHIDNHEAAGRYITVDGLRVFTRDEGEGDAVVCFHGVPASSFLYRKVLPELAGRGLRGIAFCLPGLGLSERPADFDYTWTGLGAISTRIIQELGLKKFHLVVHDIGGPVGFEVAAALKERVQSLTILNTLIRVHEFRRPWTMEPFAIPGVGELSLATMVAPAFVQLMYLQGVHRDKVSAQEIIAYLKLLKRDDGGKAFLKIMRGFQRTPEKSELYRSTARDVPYPVQIVWGKDDPALKIGHYGRVMMEETGVNRILELPGKHFFQEEQAPAIAEAVKAIAGRRSGG